MQMFSFLMVYSIHIHLHKALTVGLLTKSHHQSGFTQQLKVKTPVETSSSDFVEDYTTNESFNQSKSIKRCWTCCQGW